MLRTAESGTASNALARPGSHTGSGDSTQSMLDSGEQRMSHLRSTALAAIFAIAAVGFSGHLSSAAAQQASPRSVKVAQQTSPGDPSLIAPASSAIPSPQKHDLWQVPASGNVVGACDLRCRTGFFGYR